MWVSKICRYKVGVGRGGGEGGGVRRGGGSNTIRKDNVHVILFAQYVVMTTTPSAVDVSMVTGGCL